MGRPLVVDPGKAGGGAAALAGGGALSSALRRLTLPLILSGVALGLYLWLATSELDSIEQRQLNAPVLVENVVEHLALTAAATVVVVPLAVLAGIALTRPGLRGIASPVITIANIGQATPSIGLLVLVAIVSDIGFDRAVLALVAYSALPVLRNTMVGLEHVDRSLIEAARGVGMSWARTLLRVELPLAVPVILAGMRTALVVNVGTATLATFIDGGGLGDTINSGIRLGRDAVLVTGAALTAMMALLLDWLARGAEDLLRPRGL